MRSVSKQVRRRLRATATSERIRRRPKIVPLRAAERAERLEDCLPRAQIDEVADGDERLGDAGPAVAMLERSPAIRRPDTAAAAAARLDDGEDGDVGADAERQRQDRGDGEPRLAGQEAKRMTGGVDQHG